MSGALDAALAAVWSAAEREGIARGGPLGEFVQAVEALARGLDARLGEVAADMRRVAEADIERSRAAREMAEASARKAEAAVRGLEVETQRLQSEVVEKLTDDVAGALGEVLVVKERTRSRGSLFGLLCLGSSVGLAVFGGGYGLRAWQDRAAVAFRDGCVREVVTDREGGLYCPMRRVLAGDGRQT